MNDIEEVLSLGDKIWNLQDIDDRQVEIMQQKLNISYNLAKLLVLRNIPYSTAHHFLDAKISALMPNPSVLKDMDKVAKRIANAIKNNEKIAILGDYDVDGATSTSVMKSFLTYLGIEAIVHIPEREEGYGPSEVAFARFKEFGATLVITVDCGTTAFDILDKYSQEFDIIILDHHECETRLPKVYGVVNPKRLDDDNTHIDLRYMAAVGVVFMTVVATNRVLRQDEYYKNNIVEPNLMQWLDLVALGTICDVVPVVGINCAFVAQGLKVMANRENVGIKTLLDLANVNEKPDAYHLGFVLGPRINASGRVGKAYVSSQLLCTNNPIKAKELAEMLINYNQERKDIECFVYEQSIEMLEGNAQKYPMIAFVYNKGWHQGVIGIVAGKLKERYNVPAFVMSIEDDEVKGSARSINGIDLGALIISAKEKGVITKGGGHTMAAGFSLTEEQIDGFRDFVGQYVIKQLNNTKPHAIINIDLALNLTAVNNQLLTEIEKLKPFGTDNYEPNILIKNVYIKNPVVIGTGHIKCTLTTLSGEKLSAILFRATDTKMGNEILSRKGVYYDVVGNLRLNSWNNRSSLQFIISDIGIAK